jgi:hypothetical protein
MQNVQEMISSALSRQAESLNPAFQLMQKEIEALKLNNAPNTSVTQTSNQTISKNQSEIKKKPTPPVNKRNKLVAQAIRTSQRQKSQRAQSEPPSTTSMTPAKKKGGPRASTSPKKIPKKKPSQMVTEDFPPDFQATKVSNMDLNCHFLKLLTKENHAGMLVCPYSIALGISRNIKRSTSSKRGIYS